MHTDTDTIYKHMQTHTHTCIWTKFVLIFVLLEMSVFLLDFFFIYVSKALSRGHYVYWSWFFPLSGLAHIKRQDIKKEKNISKIDILTFFHVSKLPTQSLLVDNMCCA